MTRSSSATITIRVRLKRLHVLSRQVRFQRIGNTATRQSGLPGVASAQNIDSVIVTVSRLGHDREASWTLDELVRRVAAGLAGPAYPGAPNGRVRELPDRRVVRWYTTTGLVDRPAMQGRTALYDTRHLRQIVAVKRRQAEGRSLAEIQAELAGATDRTLRRVAAVPDELIAAEPAEPVRPQQRRPAVRRSAVLGRSACYRRTGDVGRRRRR